MRITIHAMLLAAASAFLIAQTAAAIGTSSGGVSQFSVVPAEFAAAIQEEGFALAPVDLSQVAGLSAPFFVSGENSTQSIGFFGDTVESSTDCRQIGGSSGVGYVYPSCLRSQNTLQIQFTNTIHAVSFKLHDLDSAGTDVEKLVAKSPGTDPDKFVVSTFDANGILIESHSVPSSPNARE